MSDQVVIEVSDKVDNTISKKIRAIATDARNAYGELGTLQGALNSLNAGSLGDLQKQSRDLTNSLLAQMKAVKSSTTELNNNQLAASKLATQQQRLQTETAKTASAAAKTSTEMARLTTEENKASVAAQKLATEQARTAKELSNSESAATRAALAKKRLEEAQNGAAESSFNLANGLKLVASSLIVAEYIKMSDAVTNLRSRLSLVTTGTAELNAVQQSLFTTAQEARTSYIELGNLYGQIARSAKDAGVSTQGLLGITNTISKAMIIGGGSAESMKAALVQLSQGFASGTLRGEELNSVMEQTPRLALAIAEGLGVSIGKLREMGQAGKLTGEVVLGALEKSAPRIAEEFKKMTPTIGQAFTVLNNSVTETVGKINEASGASNILASSILTVGAAVDGLGNFIKKHDTSFSLLAGGLGGVAAAGALIGIATALKAVTGGIVALSVALAANPVVLALLGIGAAVGVGVAVKSAWDKTETGINRTNEALIKQRGIIEANLKSGKLDDDQKKQNLETLATVNQRLVDNGIALDKMNGLTAQSTFRSQELTVQNAAEEASSRKKTDAQSSYKKLMEELNGVTDEHRKKVAELEKQKPYLSDSQYQAGVAKLKAEYDKLTGATKALNKESKDKRAEDLFQIKNQLDLNKLHGVYAKQADALIDSYKRQKLSAQDLTKGLTSLITKQEELNEAMKVAKLRQAAVNKDYKDSEEALADIQKADMDRVKSLRASNIELQEEIVTMGLSARGQVQYAYAKNQSAIETLKATRLAGDYNTTIEEEIKLLEQRGQLILDKGITQEISTQRAAYTDFFADIERGLTDSLYNAFQNGGSFGKTFWEGIKNMFKTTVLKFAIQGIFGGIVGNIGQMLGINLGGSGGGGGGFMGGLQTASNLNTAYGAGSQYLFGGSAGASSLSLGYANVVGAAGGDSIGALYAANGGWAGVGSGGAGAAGGSSGMGGLAASGPLMIYAAIAALIANAFGVFGERKEVGSGLTGTLGGDELQSYSLMRESGTLFSGPQYDYLTPAQLIKQKKEELSNYRASNGGVGDSTSYSLEQEIKDLERIYGDSIAMAKKQSDAIQKSYEAMRTNVGDMADVLGLSSDAVRKFTMTLGEDLVGGNSKLADTEGRGLKLQGLTPEEAADKINKALATANNTLAEQVIGNWEKYSDTVTTTTQRLVGTGEDAEYVFETVTTTTEGMRYVASEYARDGEKAIDTLTRLATSLSAVNQVFDTLNVTLLESSLAGGDLASKIVDMFGGIENFVSATSAYYEAFYTEEERRATATRQLTAEFAKQNLALPKTREEYRKLVESQDLTTEEGRKMYHFLIMLAPAFASITDEAKAAADAAQELIDKENKLKDARNSALTNLQNAVNAEKAILSERAKAVSDSIKNLDRIFDILHSNVMALFAAVSSTNALQVSQANQLINNAYATGNIGNVDRFSEAIGTARSALNPANYASQSDLDRDTLSLANKLAKLESGTVKQLTVEQQTLDSINSQIDILDETLDYWKKQIDIANGTYQATLSVGEALTAISLLLTPKTPNSTAGGKPAGSGSSGVGGITWSGNQVESKYKRPVNISGSVAYIGVGAEEEKRLDGFAALYHSFDGSGDLVGLLTAMRGAGATMSDLSALSGLYERDWVSAAASVGIPGFAKGGYHSGGAFIGNENGAELMYSPGALNIHSAPETSMMVDNGSSGLSQLAMLLSNLIDVNNITNSYLNNIVESNDGIEDDIETMKNTLVSCTDAGGGNNAFNTVIIA